MSDNSDSGRKRRKRQRSASRGGSDAGDESPDDGGWGEMDRPSGGMEGVTSTAHDGDAGSGAVGGAPTAKASRRGRGDGISNVEEENPSSLHFEDPYPDVFSGEYSDNDDDGEGGDAQGGEVDADGFTRPGPVSGRPGARDNDGADGMHACLAPWLRFFLPCALLPREWLSFPLAFFLRTILFRLFFFFFFFFFVRSGMSSFFFFFLLASDPHTGGRVVGDAG